MIKKGMTVRILCLAVCTAISVSACASDLSFEDICDQLDSIEPTERYVGSMEFTVEEVPKIEMRGLDGYGIMSKDDVYEQLSELSATREWTVPNRMIAVRNYDTTALEQFEIPNLAECDELSKIGDHFSISYTTLANEYVIAQYYPEGVYAIAVNTDLSSGNEVIEYSSEFDTIRIYACKETKLLTGARAARTAKKVEVHPNLFPGVHESDALGNLDRTSSEYCAALGKNVSVQARRVETGFKRNRVDWVSVAANMTIASFAAKYAVTERIAQTALNAAGAALTGSGIYATIQEAFNFPDTCVYSAVLGYYGDVEDITACSKKYCRIYQKVVSAKYTYGKSMSNGTNTFVREPVEEPSDAGTAIAKAIRLYNSCIASYGANTLYAPR